MNGHGRLSSVVCLKRLRSRGYDPLMKLRNRSARTMNVYGLEIPEAVYTLEGFREWVGGLGDKAPHVHFYRGRVEIERTPQDYETHVPLVKKINRVLEGLGQELSLGIYFVPPSWVTIPADGPSTEPDGFLFRWEALRSGKARITPERKTEMLGRPDMVLEVVSKTSVRKDLRELVEGYARAGVPEYWIADARRERLVFRILILGEDGRYADLEPRRGDWLRSPTWGRSFRLKRFTNQAGLADFSLEVKEG